jgi:E3 ubiquitin-protein ligase Hakai
LTMVNLKIRLSNKSGSSPGIVKNETANGSSVPIISSSGADLEGVPSSSVLPSHLVGEDLALAKGLGTVSTDSSSYVINLVGVKARRRPGDKVHICVRCNFPIAVYGRLDPCEHVYCLTCAKLDSTCFLYAPLPLNETTPLNASYARERGPYCFLVVNHF